MKLIAILLLCILACAEENPISFIDASAASGLPDRLVGIMNHASACGDVDGDGDLDFYNGNFCDRPREAYIGADGPVSNVLLLNQDGKFVDSKQSVLSWKGRTSGAVFADLDNDGDLDLYTTNNSVRAIFMPNKLFENVNGQFRDISEGNGACIQMGGRSVGVLDFDGDGLLDILVLEDVPGHTRLFRNKERLQFEDVTAAAGLTDSLAGYGVITPDLNLDGWPDIFVSLSNQLLLSKGDGTYRGGADITGVLRYRPPEGDPAGVSFGDVDRDGDMDIAIADHTKYPGARQHLFLNQGLRDGIPAFKEVSAQVGLDYIFPNRSPRGDLIKSAHIEIQDFDNDGWPDIYVAATYDNAGHDMPFVLRNLGRGPDGLVRFQPPPVGKVNCYFPSGPTGDYDRDGRVDIILPTWFPVVPSRLFLNRSRTKRWLEVAVQGKTINRSGIGCKVKIYPAGRLGDAGSLLGYEEISAAEGFCSSQEAVAHFGLGDTATCDVEVVLPFRKGAITKRAVPSDQRLVIQEK